MKKHQLLILTIITLTIISCGQKRSKIGHLEEYNLNGTVWQITKQTYEGEGNIQNYEILEIDRYNWEFPHKLVEFDKEGFVTRECDIERDGDIKNCFTQKIADLKIIKESEKDTIEIKINENGIRAEYIDNTKAQKVEYKQDGDLDIYEFSYDSLKYSNEFKLNNNGQITEGYRIDTDGEKHLGIKFDYNSNDDVIFSREYSVESDSLIKEREFIYKYDNQKNWTQKIIFENKEFLVAVKRDIKYFEECFKDFGKEDLIGMWKRNKSESWIEFFENGKIDIGMGSSIKESGKWELDEKTKRITFRIDDGGTKFDYEFSECNLILIDPTDRTDFDIYKKVDD